jgi:hypothetical protein
LAIWIAEAAGSTPTGLGRDRQQTVAAARGVGRRPRDAMHVGVVVVRLNREGPICGSWRTGVIRFTFFSTPGVKMPRLRAGDGGDHVRSGARSRRWRCARLARRRDGEGVRQRKRRITALPSGESGDRAQPAGGRRVRANMGSMLLDRWDGFGCSPASRCSALPSPRDLLTRFIGPPPRRCLARADNQRARAGWPNAPASAIKILAISYGDFTSCRRPISRRPGRRENILAQFPADGSADIADYVDFGILDDLKRQGVFAELQQRYASRQIANGSGRIMPFS